jgi:ABC-type branched-subunit amino acid transport system substrate-binding protein
MHANSDPHLKQLCLDINDPLLKQLCLDLVERLHINIPLFLTNINEVEFEGQRQIRKLDEYEQKIVCTSLQGCTPTEIAKIINGREIKGGYNPIRDRLARYIYPRVSQFLGVENIEGNWAKIVYLLSDPIYGLVLPSQITKNVNTLMSFGDYVLLRRNSRNILDAQQAGMEFYRLKYYLMAFERYMDQWDRDNGNPETLIYIMNSLVDENRESLRQRGIEIYTLAVVVPIYHNLGSVATELLRGVAQIQIQVNLEVLDSLGKLRDYCQRLREALVININNILPISNGRIVLKFLIVSENNHLGFQVNQTAEDLAKRADELGIMAVIGHYSSEMTEQALRVYARQGLLLITSSSTSNHISDLVDRHSFFRMTTQDRIATKRLADYLKNRFEYQQGFAIIYNQYSSYSQSFKNALVQHLLQEPQVDCGHLYNLQSIGPYLDEITLRGIKIIVSIPDGGIEPNSLSTAGIIGLLNMNSCLIAGSATFYHDNVLEWVQENMRQENNKRRQRLLDENHNSNVVACIPWHWHSQSNGCESNNSIARDFCRLGTSLWGDGNLSWRSATAYDSIYILVQALRRNPTQDRQVLLKKINQHLRGKNNHEMGVTGKIKFDLNGDRLEPPTEMVAVRWNSQTGLCEWLPA